MSWLAEERKQAAGGDSAGARTIRRLRRLAGLPHRRDTPARKRPVPEDAATARRLLLDGLARDASPFQLVNDLAVLHPRDNTVPGEVFPGIAADALSAAVAYVRAAASRAGVPVRQACQDLGERPGHPAP